MKRLFVVLVACGTSPPSGDANKLTCTANECTAGGVTFELDASTQNAGGLDTYEFFITTGADGIAADRMSASIEVIPGKAFECEIYAFDVPPNTTSSQLASGSTCFCNDMPGCDGVTSYDIFNPRPYSP